MNCEDSVDEVKRGNEGGGRGGLFKDRNMGVWVVVTGCKVSVDEVRRGKGGGGCSGIGTWGVWVVQCLPMTRLMLV